MPQSQLSKRQIDAFADALVFLNLIKKSDIELNRDLLEESLKLSQTTGLEVQLYSYQQLGNSSISIQKPGISNYNGQPLVKTEWDPVKIFEMLYTSKKNTQTQEERE